MSLTIRLFAVFRERIGRPALELPAAPGDTVASVWERVVDGHPDLGALRPSTRFAVNGVYAPPETAVRDGDEVAFLPPMSGG